ncbi:MAG: S9 family peptidase [Hyphomicrobiaceae bacterium]
MAELATDIDILIARELSNPRPAIVRMAEAAVPADAGPEPQPPKVQGRPVSRTVHGVTLTDPFAWLRADNWQDATNDVSLLPGDIRTYLEAENAYTKAMLADVGTLEEEIYQELRKRTKEDEQSTPFDDGSYQYYERGVVGKDYDLHCRQPKGGGPEEVLIDGNALAEGHSFFNLYATAHSPDHKLVAYAVDLEGSERYAIKVRDLAARADVSDTVSSTDGTILWSADSRSFYYVGVNENIRSQTVFLHRLGTPQADDILIYEEKDPGFLVQAGVTSSGRYLQVITGDNQTNEVWLKDLADPQSELTLFAARKPGVRTSVTHSGEKLYVLTNAGDAPDFRILEADAVDPNSAHWREIVPHVEGRPINEVEAVGAFLVRRDMLDGLDRIIVRFLATGEEHVVRFPEEAYELDFAIGYEFNTTKLRISYSSMTTQLEDYDYDMATQKRVLRRRQEIPSGHDPSAYETRRVFATADDGETIPVTLLYKKGLVFDGTAPALVEGYGAYGVPTTPYFDIARMSLVDRGFVYAIAHVRGGLEKGDRWYRLGRGPDKPNTFKDFIAVARMLEHERIVRPGGIAAYGASAGGMLIGAIANMAPGLFHTLVADVPFVDVLNTMLDSTLPLTPTEYPEWGNPEASEADFRLIRSYSPYDNVFLGTYPHLLVLGSLSDTRVTYWEPAKWVAKLRVADTGPNMLLLDIELNAGHGGGSGLTASQKRWARIAAFVIKAERAGR